MARGFRRTLRHNAAVIKLIVFAIVTSLTTLVVAVTIGNITTSPTYHYSALFTDVTGVLPGDDVRVAGVRVGRVTSVSVEGKDAKLGLEVDKTVHVSTTTLFRVRYRDLLGRRYVSITQGTGDGTPLYGGRIGLDHTAPALDLTTLFNGFRPIFATVQPADVNKLASEIVATLQGEGGTVSSLLLNTAQLTNSLADRDAVIGRVVTNLNAILGTVAQRDQALQQLITNLRDLATGLAGDRDAIGSSLANIDALAAAATDLLRQARPALDPSIRDLGIVVKTAADNKAIVNRTVAALPATLDALVRAQSYGSWLNLYICDVSLTMNGASIPLNGTGSAQSPRCTP